MKKKETLIHHYAVLIVLALITVLSIVLLIMGSAATIGSTYGTTDGTYQLIGETNNANGTHSYNTATYGTANLVVFKQATSFVVWVDSTVNDSNANIIAAVQALGSSYANMDYWAVTTATPSFHMYTVLQAANPSANLNENALDVTITFDTSAHTFALSKQISHYSLFKYSTNTASLVVDKDVTGTNASTTEDFSITVTFSGTGLGSITNNAGLPVAGNGIYTLLQSGSDAPVTFSNIPYGTSYTVTESVTGAQATAGWSYTSGAVTAPVILNSGNTSDMVTLLNTFSQTASLVVDKNVLGTGASASEKFSITVTFTGSNVGGITNSAGLTGTSGVYTVLLSGSDTPVTFSNIPYETSYTVTETVSGAQTAAGWAYTSGQVTAPVVLNDSNTSDTVTLVNTYTEPTATLVIDKTVTGTNAPTAEPFGITVTFTGSVANITNNGSLPVASDGVYTFTLSAGAAPVTFSNIPYGTSYTVTEAITGDQTSAGWTYTTGAVTQAVVLDSANPSDAVEIINNYGPTASLVVDKNVTGTDASATEEFSITVTFTGTGLGSIANNGGLPVAADGVYTLALSGSDAPVTFSNIPYGTQYTVTEAVSGTQSTNGWSYTSGAVSEAVTLNAGNPADAVEILNTYTPTATLVIDKFAEGLNPSTAEAFSITVTFTGSGNLSGIMNNGNLNGTNGVYTFPLSAGATPVTFSKIPFGTSYTVTEAVSPGQTAAGWAYTSGQVSDPAALNTETPVNVTLVNTYTPTATLVIDKSVIGTNASTEETFTITVTFTGSGNLGGIVNNAGLSGINGVYTFQLSAGSNPVEFSKIPYGTSYTVAEAISGGQASAGWTNTSGTVTQPVQLGSENPTDTVTVVNNYGPTGSLVIDKNVFGTNASPSEEFTVTVTFTGNNLGNITNNVPGLTGTGGVYTFTLSGSDDHVIFSNIPYGTQYTVNETISDTQANVGWAYTSGKVTEPVVLNTENTSDIITLVNTFTPQTPPPPPVPEDGSLTVTKNVSGIGASTTEEFTMTVQFTGSFGGIANDAGLIGTGGVYTLALVDNESVTFSNIPTGTSYTITENLTAAQTANGWAGPAAASGTVSSTAPVEVTVENIFTGTGVAGANDQEVAGDSDTLPQTGGTSLSTQLGIMGLILVASGGAVLFIFRKHRYNSN